MPHSLLKRVQSVRAGARRLTWLHAAARTATCLVSVAGLAALADALIHFQDRGLRFMASALVAGVTVAAAVAFMLPAFRRRLGLVEVARRIECVFPQLSDRLTSAVEFLNEDEDDPTVGSAELRRAVVNRTEVDSQGLDYHAALDSKMARRATWTAIAVCLAVAAASAVRPDLASIAVARLLVPWGNTAWPQTSHLAFVDPPSRLAQGSEFNATVVDSLGAKLPVAAFIEFRFTDADGNRNVEREPMRLVDGAFRASRANLLQPFEYRAVGGDDQSMPWLTLDVLEPPLLAEVHVTVLPPAYTGLAARASEPHVRGIAGSTLEIRAACTKPLARAFVVSEDGQRVTAQLTSDRFGLVLPNERDETLTLAKSGSYWFELEDAEGVLGGEGIRYEMQAVTDEPPSVIVEEPAADLFVTAKATVPLRILVKDDLAIHKINLAFSRSDQTQADELIVPLWAGPDVPLASDEPRGDSRTVDWMWNLGQPGQPTSGLTPGTRIRFFALATDYRPSEGRSTPRQLTVVTVEELESRIAERQGFIIGELSRLLKLQEEARTQTRSVEIQIESVGRLSRGDVDQLHGAEVTQREVARGVTSTSDGVPAAVASLLADLDNNQLASPDLRRRMDELSDRLAALGQGPLPAVERDLTEAVKSGQNSLAATADAGSAEAVASPLQSAAQGQEQVMAELAALLSDFSQWQDWRQLSRDVATLHREQEQIIADTEATARTTLTKDASDLSLQEKADLTRLSERQQELARRLDGVRDRMQKAKDQLAAQEPLAAESLGDALDYAGARNTGGAMQQAGRLLGMNHMGKAQPLQKETLDDLQEMMDILSNRSEHELERLAKKLEEAENELANLQRRQEGLRKAFADAHQIPDAERRRRELERLTREQEQLEQDSRRLARRLERLSARDASQSLARGAGKMGQAGRQGQSGQGGEASDTAEQALRDLEDAQDRLAERRREVEDDLAVEQLARLEDEIQTLAERQQGILDETRRMDGLKREKGTLTRGQAASLLDLARVERDLSAETAGWAEKLTATAVFQLALEIATADMQEAAGSMEGRLTGSEAQEPQERALLRIAQLLEALKPDHDSENGQEESDGQGGEGGEGGGGAGQGDGQNAQRWIGEVKLLRLMQQDLNERTRDFGRSIDPTKTLTDKQKEEYARLSEEQGRLARLAEGFMELQDQSPEFEEGHPLMPPGERPPDDLRIDEALSPQDAALHKERQP